MKVADRVVPVRRGQITLVAKKTFGVSGNIRVVADALADLHRFDLYLFYEGPLDESTAAALEQKGITLLRDFGPRAAHILASSQLVVVDHSIRDCYISERKPGRTVANVWHGVPIKGIELSMPKVDEKRRQLIEHNAKLYDWMIASSQVDRMAISSSFGVPPSRVWATGLPRYDLLDSKVPLPPDIEAMERELLGRKGEQSLLLYAPTFREQGDSPVSALAEQLPALRALLHRHGYRLGIRPHPYDREAQALCDDPDVLDLSSNQIAETNIVLKHTDVLVTDFSSIWVDFLLTGRPIVGFATDFDSYLEKERGFLYDFEDVFAGPFCHDPASLLETLESLVSAPLERDSSRLSDHLFLPKAPGPYGLAVAQRLASVLENQHE